jgi:phosphate transport system substrate-binding protein
LKVYYDEGLAPHIKNQTATFESQYARAHVLLYESTEAEAVQALYHDSCEAIVISRLLSMAESKAFASRSFYPKYSAVAYSGIAIITNIGTPVNSLTMEALVKLLKVNGQVQDSAGTELNVKVLIAGRNSSVSHYLADSLMASAAFGKHCNALRSTPEVINFVAANKSTIAFIDFAWLSDVDDSLFKANKAKIKFVAIKTRNGAVYPDQSNFKLGIYPLTRTVYIMRKTGEFSLAKGYESFVAGPKGQLTFLKQGLLPHRQSERQIKINLEPLK